MHSVLTRLFTVSLALLLLVPAFPAMTGTVGAQESEYVLEQGDRCIPISPLEGGKTGEAFYNYSNDTDSSVGTVELQEENTSVVFLYQSPDGLNLVMVHGKLGGDGMSGSASFTIRGLSESATWAVEDDNYTAATEDDYGVYDQWEHTSERSEVDWTWYRNRTDGAVVSGLDADLQITIEPGFNEDAALYNEFYFGNVTDWQVLSGSQTDPERTSLALDETVVIRRGTC